MTTNTAEEYLDVQASADFLGVSPATIHTYRSKGIMPDPDKTFGSTPTWLPSTLSDWKAKRPGQGKGGGRKPKDGSDG